MLVSNWHDLYNLTVSLSAVFLSDPCEFEQSFAKPVHNLILLTKTLKI